MLQHASDTSGLTGRAYSSPGYSMKMATKGLILNVSRYCYHHRWMEERHREKLNLESDEGEREASWKQARRDERGGQG